MEEQIHLCLDGVEVSLACLWIFENWVGDLLTRYRP